MILCVIIDKLEKVHYEWLRDEFVLPSYSCFTSIEVSKQQKQFKKIGCGSLVMETS